MSALQRLTGLARAGLVAGTAALALALASCSGGTSVGGDAPEGASGASAGKGDVTGEIRLAFWGSGIRVEKTNGVSELFVKANPGVTVTPNFSDFAAYFQKLNIEATSGNLACVTQLQGRQLNDYASKGLLLDLQPMIDSGAINVANIPKEVLDTGRGTDGKLYEIPYGAAYDSIMINTALPEGVKAASLGGGLPNYFIEYVRAQGQELFVDNKAAFSADMLVEFWNAWEELRKAGATTTAQDEAAEPTQTEQSYIATGKVLLDNKPGNQLGQAQDALEGVKPGQKLTTIQLPGGPNGASGTVLFTSGWSIPKNCNNIPTAAAYINFWINDHEANALFASNNGAVTNTVELESQLKDASLDPATKHSLELFQEIVKTQPPTVLYLTQVMAGPFCTMILADLGADVIKIENPDSGDQSRRSWGRSGKGEDSRAFMSLNRNKRSVVLDLKSDQGRADFHRLCASADVVVENWRPGVASKLGVDFETLSAINPRLVYASISGFGLSGPYADRPGYDLVAQAMSGVMSITGEPDGRPVKSGIPVADLGAGMFCAIGILAAWIAARETGRGQRVETSLFESALALAVWESTEFWDTGRVPQKLGSANRMSAPYQALATRNGYITIGANNDRLWRRLCTALDLVELLDDERFRTNPDRMSHRAELAAALEERLGGRDTTEWGDLLLAAGVPAGPIQDYGQVLSEDPHVKARGMIAELDHPVEGQIPVLASPLRLTATPPAIRRPPPLLGEHTDEVLDRVGVES